MTNPTQSAIIHAILEKRPGEEQYSRLQKISVSPGKSLLLTDQTLSPATMAISFLNLACNKFDEMFEEVMNGSFWSRNRQYRFARLREGFLLFRVIQHYERAYCSMAGTRKPSVRQGAAIGSELFRFIKNITIYFRFFENWEEVYIAASLCHKRDQLIDGFLRKNCGKEPLKVRFWEKYKKKMVCLGIYFPKVYGGDRKIFLKDMLSEEEGMKFSFIYMRKIIASQVKRLSSSIPARLVLG